MLDTTFTSIITISELSNSKVVILIFSYFLRMNYYYFDFEKLLACAKRHLPFL